MGGDLIIGDAEAPLPLADSSDMVGASVRTEHVRELLPEICTLDCGTMNFSHGDYIMANTPSMLRAMAAQMQAAGVRPEIEVFDTGHLVLAKQLVSEGLIDDPVMVQLCMGIPYGAPDDINTFMSMVNNMPADWIWSAFSIGRSQLPYAALAPVAGGNVRVGLEDTIYLSRGQLATNAQLVERAATILSAMNMRIMTPEDVRQSSDCKNASQKRHLMKTIGKAAAIGGGVIGGGWIARLILAGVDVSVFDPDPEAERKITAIIQNADRAMARLWQGQATGDKGKLEFVGSIAEAVKDADLIQESTPERLRSRQR